MAKLLNMYPKINGTKSILLKTIAKIIVEIEPIMMEIMYKGEIIENCESEKFNNKEGHHPYVTELLGITQSDYVRDNPDNVKMDSLKLGHGCKYYNHCTLTSKNTRCRLVSPPAISLLSNSILLNDDPNQPWVKCWDFLNG